MAGWAGFSDADLMQIKQTTSPAQSRQNPNNAAKQAAVRKQKVQQQRELARQRALEFSQGGDAHLPASQRLSSPPTPASKEEANQHADTGAGTKTTAGERPPAGSCEKREDNSKEMSPAGDKGDEPGGASLKEFNEEEGLKVEMNRVEQFRVQQKKMEEENKQRRRILANAIKQRSKMAKEEAEKLTKVQNELKHLDQLVNADVAIIRDKIEAASLDFLQAQKRYEKAEKEFVESKMALAEKSELKESLTEHLYTIIQQNEARKAERLAILMEELGMEIEHYPIPKTVPQMLSFSPINTLHRPNAPPTSPLASSTTPEQATEQGSNKDSPQDAENSKESSQDGKDSLQGAQNEDGSQDGKGTSQDGSKGSQDAAVVNSSEQEDKCGKDSGASLQTAGKEKSGDSKTEEDEKTVDGQELAEKHRVENGSPESLDGGANTVA